MKTYLIKTKHLLTLVTLLLGLLILNPLWAEEDKSITEQFEEAMTAFGLGGEYQMHDKYISWTLTNYTFDFSDGNEEVTIEMNFRINKDELKAYIEAGNDFAGYESLDGFDKVEGYQFWAINSSNSTDKLFVYPDVKNESALVKKLLSDYDFIHVAVSNHGIIYLIDSDKKLHRAILHHYLTPPKDAGATNAELSISSLDNLNDDDWNDFQITYENGYKQIAYYKTN